MSMGVIPGTEAPGVWPARRTGSDVLLSRMLTDISDTETVLNSLDFKSMTVDGRSGVYAHHLYTTDDTGPNGPAAALVRYEPGACTPPHRHPGYELVYVLDGELVTDQQRHPRHTLVVMAPNSVHAPRSETGCLLLVVWEQPVEKL